VKEEDYTGENEKWFEFNKRITIHRDGKPYLKRHTLITFGKWLSFKIHTILQSDGECDHDHPWGFITVILKTGYYEWTPRDQKDSGTLISQKLGVDGVLEDCHFHKPGSIMYRPAKWRHRLNLPVDYKNLDDPNRLIPAKTFVITGKVIRDWGFFTQDGWKIWTNYEEKRDC